MACPKFLRTDLNPTGQSGGQWTYVGYNSSVPGPTWAGTPSISLVNVAAGQVYTPGNDNPTINPLGVSAGFYAFDYIVTAPVSGGNACSDTERIVIQVAPAACAGQSRSISLCGDSSVLNLVDELEDGSACAVTIDTASGSATSNAGYTGSPSYTFDPSLSPAGTFTFTNTVNVDPYSGFAVNCADCANSAATLSLSVTPVEAIDSVSESVCTGFDESLDLYDLSGSAVTNGSWYYWSGPNPTQNVNWNGSIISATAGQLLSIGDAAILSTGNLPAGDHVFRYVTSIAPCYRYKDVTIQVGAVPSAGTFNQPITICGGPNCQPILINSLLFGETPGGTFQLTTTSEEPLTISIDGAPPVILSDVSSVDGIPYTGSFLITTFPGELNVASIATFYEVVNGACEAQTSGNITILPPNTGMDVVSSELQQCVTTTPFLLKDNFSNFRAGGHFTMRYRSSLATGYFNYTGAAFTNQLVGLPPPPNATHSLTAGFNPAVAPSGWYEVKYTRSASGGVAGLCVDCQERSWTYIIRLNGNACGCFSPCDVSSAFDDLDVCTGYTDAYGNTYNAFVSNTLVDVLGIGNPTGYNLVTSCPVQPNYNFWRYYITQGPSSPTINGSPASAYPFQAPATINWATTTPGVYTMSYQPQLAQTGGNAYDQGECFTGFSWTITACPPTPCNVNITSLAWNGTTITPTVTGCVGTPTYSWVGPNSYTATSTTINPPRVGSYTLTVTCPDGGTCTSTSTLVLDCDDITTTISPSTGDITAAVSAGPCTTPTYSWARPNGGGTSTGATIVPNNGNGNYVVTTLCGGVSTGCTDTFACNSSVSISNNGVQLIAFAGGCGSNPANYTYAWSSSSGFTSTAQTISPPASGTYNLTVTCVDTGCVVSASAVFTFTCNLAVTIAAAGNNLVATGSGTCTGGSYAYSWNAQPSNVTTLGSTVAYVAGQTYTVTMTCVGGPQGACAAATASFSCPSFTVNIA